MSSSFSSPRRLQRRHRQRREPCKFKFIPRERGACEMPDCDGEPNVCKHENVSVYGTLRLTQVVTIRRDKRKAGLVTYPLRVRTCQLPANKNPLVSTPVNFPHIWVHGLARFSVGARSPAPRIGSDWHLDRLQLAFILVG